MGHHGRRSKYRPDGIHPADARRRPNPSVFLTACVLCVGCSALGRRRRLLCRYVHLSAQPNFLVVRHDFLFAAGFFFNRSNTAATISGSPTVASTKTSPNFPPSAGGTNFPHETASL